MKLTLTLIAASLVLRFTAPGHGSFYLLSSADGYYWNVECADHVEVPTHVVYEMPATEAHRIFAVQWEESNEVATK